MGGLRKQRNAEQVNEREGETATLLSNLTCELGVVWWRFRPTLSPPLGLRGNVQVNIQRINHVQLAMPPGKEGEARAFYSGILGIPEMPKPPNLAKRGGAWFEVGALRVHLGVEADFRPAQKAHPAFEVQDLAALIEACTAGGYRVNTDEPLPGYKRAYVFDPFGNRIELMEPVRSVGA